MRWMAPIILMALGLSGCAGAPQTYGESVRSSYSRSEFGYGAGRRDLWTQFRGDPFEIGEEDFQARMIEILAHHPPKPQPTNYTTQPGDSANTNYRVVFVFDPPKSFLNSQLCRLPTDLPKGDGGTRPLNVAAAFCRNQGMLTAIRGSLTPVEGMSDPAFDALIGQMVDGLFPNIDPSEDDDDCAFPSRCR